MTPMPAGRRILAALLAVVMFVSTAWCICMPDSLPATTADPTEHSCCEKKPADEPAHHQPNSHQPAQDCPSCGWSILRSARLVDRQHHASDFVPTLAAFAITIDTTPAIRTNATAPTFTAPLPRPPTLLDLHCMLLT